MPSQQYVRFGPNPGSNTTPPPAGIAALAMVYLFALAFNAGWGPVAWVYVSEIPSNRLRAYNVALASFTHWVMNLVVSKTTPVMLVETPYKTYFIFGAINVVMAVVAFWIPETKGVSFVFFLFAFPFPFHLFVSESAGANFSFL